MNNKGYRVEPFPKIRRFALDAGRLGRRSHIVHGLLEVDVTSALEHIRAHEAESGEKLSFTAFVIRCLGKAIESNPDLHAYRNWRNQLVIYDDVQIITMIEVEKDGHVVPMPHLLKNVNKRSLREIHEEIRAVKRQPSRAPAAMVMSKLLAAPGFLRHLLYWMIMRAPQMFRQYSSPVMVTAVGMFARGGFWGIPMPSQTLTITIGGFAEKPGVVDGRIEVRQFVHLTVSFDHDIVDGAPGARFTQQFRELLEDGYGLVVPMNKS